MKTAIQSKLEKSEKRETISKLSSSSNIRTSEQSPYISKSRL